MLVHQPRAERLVPVVPEVLTARCAPAVALALALGVLRRLVLAVVEARACALRAGRRVVAVAAEADCAAATEVQEPAAVRWVAKLLSDFLVPAQRLDQVACPAAAGLN